MQAKAADDGSGGSAGEGGRDSRPRDKERDISPGPQKGNDSEDEAADTQGGKRRRKKHKRGHKKHKKRKDRTRDDEDSGDSDERNGR
jgi:hypothetical protein